MADDMPGLHDKQIQPISSRNLSNKSGGTHNGLRFLKDQKING